jgi:periplasmic divalent cation tolerance protein
VTMTDVLIVYTTVADDDAATSLADLLVAERVAACVQIAPIRSVYRWQGRTQRQGEVQLAIKTTSERFDAVAALLVEHHPYELPEIVAVPVIDGSRKYLDWLRRETRVAEDLR